MMIVRRIVMALWSLVLVSAPALAFQPPAQSEFVPVTDLPAGDQLPAAPYLIAAYVVVWLAVMLYVWTIWRRLNRVETDMRALAERQQGAPR
jgi:CcmD family protein